MKRQQAEKAFTESVVKHIYELAHPPGGANPVAEAFSSFSVGDGSGLGAYATQTDFVVVLASVRSAVLDLLEQAGVIGYEPLVRER